jgi:ubiquinone/menaquinone biosynthesis C-methylase UbiE
MEQFERLTTRKDTNEKVIWGESEASHRFTSSLFYQVMAPVMAVIMESRLRRRLNNADRILEGAGVRPGIQVLEVGCGTGYFSLPAAQRIGEAGHLHATDISPQAVSLVRDKVGLAGLKNVRTGVADAKATGLQPAAFDLVLLLGVVPAPMLPAGLLLPEMHRVLKPEGVLAVWPEVPFWMRPTFEKSGLFALECKVNGVLRFRKIPRRHDCENLSDNR